ncbi:MAG: hypothetical protein GY948_13445 [Alphaproteobacteria bacterium]|nr:hypothetical protein [Alphaproteobacteria bacterium]
MAAKWTYLLAALMLGLVFPGQNLRAAEQLKVLAHVGPWPVIDRLIAYRGRLWFSNSVKGQNHNSADIWSYDPASGNVRYERYLHSQDAGGPLIHRDLLYWPFEDSRFSLGWGMIEVTNGEEWAPLLVPTAEIFHVHHLAERKGDLLAVSSAWRAGYQRSRDGGKTWQQAYDHETPKGRVSRFTTTVTVGSLVYSRLRAGGKTTLTVWNGNGPVRQVTGWPQGSPVSALLTHKDAAYAVTRQNQTSSVWRLKGEGAERLAPPEAAWPVIDFTSDGRSLWAVTRIGDQSKVWQSKDDGETWTVTHMFSGGSPWPIHIMDDQVYVGGRGADGIGILWGPALSGRVTPKMPDAPALPEQFLVGGSAADWPVLGKNLLAVLGDVKNYENHGRGAFRSLIIEAVRKGAPSGFFQSKFGQQFPSALVGTFGGQLKMEPAEIGTTLLLWGMGLAGHQNVPPTLLAVPWSKPKNPPEKYFAPILTGLWAISVSGQNDKATIDALIARLGESTDPDWLQSQIIGTLTAITSQRFAYNIDAWRDWWQAARGG